VVSVRWGYGNGLRRSIANEFAGVRIMACGVGNPARVLRRLAQE
jgi:hypothetical protein